ncbi:unnamed protein product [Rotaria sp. Silwood1]|nr:unnamed protein product [Rotaria sp. Silwood1]CAF3466885.1 unnamed protein product [Rotaria sp. Silwood1]
MTMNKNRTSANSIHSSLWMRDLHSGTKSPRRHYNTGRLPQTSSIRIAATDNEQCQTPLKLQGWLKGDTNEAIKFWERALLFFEELDKRQNISDKNRAELKQLKAKYKEHEEQINQIK